MKEWTGLIQGIFIQFNLFKEMHQTHQSRLTTMSNQLEAKYEQRIHSLLEQIKANEPQKVKTDIHNGLMPNLFTIVRLISTLSLSRSRSRTLKKQE